MIYLLYGNDTKRARLKLSTLIKTLEAKKPDATLIRVEDDTFREDRLKEYIGAQGLFESRLIVVFDGVFKNKDAGDGILSSLKELSQSENICIFLEEVLDKKALILFKKYTEKIQIFLLETRAQRKDAFNIFSLTDALGERNKKKLWVLYQKGILNDVPPEEIQRILFWGVKSMHIACSAQKGDMGGLNPFVFRKMTRFARNYSTAELNMLSSTLSALYHDARGGICPLDIALERFILSV